MESNFFNEVLYETTYIAQEGLYDENKDVNNIISSLSKDEKQKLFTDYTYKPESSIIVYERVYTIDNKPTGYIRLVKEETKPVCSVELAVHSKFRRRGLASTMLRDMLNNNFGHDIIAYTPENSNVNSIKVAERNGFKLLEKQKHLSIYLYDKKHPNKNAKDILKDLEGATNVSVNESNIIGNFTEHLNEL